MSRTTMEIRRRSRMISLIPRLDFLSAAIFLLSAVTLTLGADENRKNHAPEKRQDTSHLFGGWTPIKPGNPFYHGQRGTTDLLTLSESGLDTAATFYSSLHEKDIYSYYPRPAIKPRPKLNTPVYTESLIKRGRRPQKYNRGPPNPPHVAIAAVKDFPIEHLKGLHEAFLAAQPLPIAPLSFANQRGKNPELLEIAVHPIKESIGEINGGGYSAFPQGRHPARPLNLGYPSIPGHNRGKPNFQRSPPNHSPIVPVPFAHIPASDIVDVKNIQVVEYPVPAAPLRHVPNGKPPRGNGHYGRQRQPSRLILPQGHPSAPRYPSKLDIGQQEYSYQGTTHKSRQPSRDYPSDVSHRGQINLQEIKLDYDQQPQISAELIKVSDEHLKSLLKGIQVVDKTSKDIFTYVPLSDVQNSKDGNLHLLVAVPQEEAQAGGSASHKQSHSAYEPDYDHGGRANDVQSYGSPEITHNEYQEERVPQRHRPSQPKYGAYQTKGHRGTSYQSEGQVSYQPEGQAKYQPEGEISYQPEGQVSYQPEEQVSYQPERQVSYQPEGHHGQQSGGDHGSGRYQAQNQYGETTASEPHSGGYEQDQSQSDDGPGLVHTGKFIEVTGARKGADGYQREPVLALELKDGQSVEEAIRALDPETLQKLGAYSKDGLEIEIVEVSGDEYGSESQKHETVVPNAKSTSGKKILRATVRSSKKQL